MQCLRVKASHVNRLSCFICLKMWRNLDAVSASWCGVGYVRDNFMQLYDRRPASTHFLIPENLARFYRRFVSIHAEHISLRLIKQRIKWNTGSFASARSAKCVDRSTCTDKRFMRFATPFHYQDMPRKRHQEMCFTFLLIAIFFYYWISISYLKYHYLEQNLLFRDLSSEKKYGK